MPFPYGAVGSIGITVAVLAMITTSEVAVASAPLSTSVVIALSSSELSSELSSETSEPPEVGTAAAVSV